MSTLKCLVVAAVSILEIVLFPTPVPPLITARAHKRTLLYYSLNLNCSQYPVEDN